MSSSSSSSSSSSLSSSRSSPTADVLPEDDLIFPIVRSPEDDRDFVYEHISQGRATAVAPPSTLDLRKYLNPPRNQGRKGACAAFSASAIKEYHERLDVGFEEYMSPDSIYVYRANKPSSGMFLRDVMAILSERGIAPERDVPYTQDEPAPLSDAVVERARDYKIASYAQVHTIEGLKEALYLNGPCLIAFPVYDARPKFWTVNKDPTQKGGHVVTVVGYTKDAFIIRNSWGANWNGDGTILYPFSEWGSHWECWSAVDEASPRIIPPVSVCQKISNFMRGVVRPRVI